MRVLFISTAIPPFPESQTIRNIFFIKGLVRRGFEVTVVTPEFLRGDKSLLQGMPPGCEYARTPRPPFDVQQEALARLPRVGKSLAWLHGILAGLFAVPDYRSGWDRLALSVCSELDAAREFDAVISSSGSYTAHLAANAVSRLWGLPWVADYGDPWSLNSIWPSNSPHLRLLNRRMERAVLPDARAVVFSTEETLRAYEQWLGSRLPPAFCIPCGYSLEEFAEVASLQSPTGKDLCVSYVGVAYRSNRNLIPAIEAMAELQKKSSFRRKVSLHIVGPHSRFFEKAAQNRDIQHAVQFLGRVSYSESIEHIRRSHCLLLIGNRGTLQIPGKVYMYLASGRPILYIGQLPRQRDPSYQLLSRFSGVLYADMSSRTILAALEELCSEYGRWQELALQRRTEPALRQYEWNALGNRFASLVAEAVPAAAACANAT
jgi:hypothetical protein